MKDDAPTDLSASGRSEFALRRFDELNAQDPNTELVNGLPRPRELVYAKRLMDWALAATPSTAS